MDAIFHIGIAQGFFAAFILFKKQNRSLADVLLAIWMIMISFELLHMLFDISNSPWHRFTSNFSFFSLTFGPFLYLYVNKLIGADNTFRRQDLLHFIPYLVFVLIHLIFFTNQREVFTKADFSNGLFDLSSARVITLFFSLVIYSSLVIKKLSLHRKWLKENYSYESSAITLKWLTHISYIFIITYSLLVSFTALKVITGHFYASSHIIPATGLTIICFSLSYYGFNQPSLFLERMNTGQIPKGKPDSILMKKLLQCMKNDKPYLIPELTIEMLSDEAGISRQMITKILHEKMKKNFFTFVNEYRIEEAKKGLTDPAFRNLSVLSIALECGFNSKSSFNALFKKYTGLTPTAFRSQSISAA